MYTHGMIDRIEDKETVNWTFCCLAFLSALLTMFSGLIFLFFAYILHVAHIKKSLFDSGLLVDENTDDGRGALINPSMDNFR